jgi:hypothetical protein
MAVDWRDPKFEDVDHAREATCARKVNSYATKDAARAGAKIAGRRLGVRLYSYECGYCGRWHLTKIDPATERARRRSGPFQDRR